MDKLAKSQCSMEGDMLEITLKDKIPHERIRTLSGDKI